MSAHELTRSVPAATVCIMRDLHETPGSGWRAVRAGVMLVAALLVLSGCISVAAPDKPIVIELNINIKQEVIYRLSADAANTIEKNPEIF
jgi:predicted component of type VI protein secretion system